MTDNAHWVFGYGSLIYKVDFDFLQRRPAWIDSWERRFWQGSHDHRGTPEAPGRVVTLTRAPGARCHGMGYLIDYGVFEHLDHREKNGYERFDTPLHFSDGQDSVGTVYIATSDNHAYLGPATATDIARHIASSEGPSGSNRDYLLELARALRELSIEDAHVFQLERLVRSLPGHRDQNRIHPR